MPDNSTAMAAYEAVNSTGWAACDKTGRTWPVTAKQAETINASRQPKQEQPA